MRPRPRMPSPVTMPASLLSTVYGMKSLKSAIRGRQCGSPAKLFWFQNRRFYEKSTELRL